MQSAANRKRWSLLADGIDYEELNNSIKAIKDCRDQMIADLVRGPRPRCTRKTTHAWESETEYAYRCKLFRRDKRRLLRYCNKFLGERTGEEL